MFEPRNCRNPHGCRYDIHEPAILKAYAGRRTILSDIFGISVSALQAFQSAINVVGNNIANASTPGYAKESISLTAAAPQGIGTVAIGDGVVVNGVSRSFNQATANQLNSSQSSLGQLNAMRTYTSQIDNLVGTTAGGLSTSVQNFYSAWSDVANSPVSAATRQALGNAFRFEPRGPLEVKGKGPMETYFLYRQ